jgi:hypothetical protein
MSRPGVMNYKRHNQGQRAHVRRKYLGGYWLPKWAREKKTTKRFLDLGGRSFL